MRERIGRDPRFITGRDNRESGGWIENANMSGWRVSGTNLIGSAITDCRIDGMTIDGILVTDLLAAYRAQTKV